MAATLEELRANIDAAVVPGFRARLLARGQARAMIWRDGVLPEDAPNFGAELSDDLLSYGYSLLQHGLRYTDMGGDAETARIIVSDDGPGMDANTAAHALDRFAPGGALRRGERALGLGLPLARRIVEAHGGTIALVSEQGAGTLVTIEVPRG